MPRLTAPSRPVIAALAAALVGAAAMPVLAQSTDSGEIEAKAEAAPEMTKGEKRLAKLLEGRVAGEPQRCIRTTPSMPMQTIEKTAYVYGRGSTIYVQRTSSPDRIDDGDALVTNRFNASELCKLDQMTTVDRVLGFFTGAVFFEDFVPYTRTKGEAGAEG